MSTATAGLHKRAHSRWNQNRRKLKALGRWEPFVDAQPVRERVWELNRAGMPTTALTERLGLLPTALDHLVWKRDGEFSREVRAETAEAVMGYVPTLEDFPPRSLIDVTGTLRRFRALMTLGWTQVAVARRMSVPNRSLNRSLAKPRVTADLARRMARVYDELWKCGPGTGEVSVAGAHRARLHAQLHGFHGPLAWDDDTIDDPRAVPQTDALTPAATDGGNLAARWLMGESVVLDHPSRREVIQHFMEWTKLTPDEMGERLEMKGEAVSRAWERIKEKARNEGAPVPWRRVYAQRDKNLMKTDMGEAA